MSPSGADAVFGTPPGGPMPWGHETRKVQVTGKSTHIISLPKRWVDALGVQAGDLFDILPRQDGTLLLRPRTSRLPVDEGTLRLDARMGHERLLRRFVAAYVAGWTQVRLAGTDGLGLAEVHRLRRLTHSVIGPQVVDETAETVTLRIQSDPGSFLPIAGLQRLAVLTEEVHHGPDHGAGSREEALKVHGLIMKQCRQALVDAAFADRIRVDPVDAAGHLGVADALAAVARLPPTPHAALGHIRDALDAYVAVDMDEAERVLDAVGAPAEAAGPAAIMLDRAADMASAAVTRSLVQARRLRSTS